MPELIGLLLVLVALAVVVSVVVGGTARARALPPAPSRRARWRAGNRTEGDLTVVHVLLCEPEDGSSVLERRDVGSVPNLDPDYDERVAALMETARERAVLLDLNRD